MLVYQRVKASEFPNPKIDEGKVDVWTPDGPWVRFHWSIPVGDVGQGSSLGQQTNELRRHETLMVVMSWTVPKNDKQWLMMVDNSDYG